MSEQLNTLIKLQNIDSLILSLKQKLEIIPLEIKKLDEKIQEIDKSFENERKKVLNLEKIKKEKERQIEDINEKIRKFKEKTSQVKTNKEYQALLKEIELIEENLKKEEENFLIILYKLEEANKNLNQFRSKIDLDKKEIDKQKKELEDQKVIINQKIENLREDRKKLIAELSSEYYEEYRELMKKHKGLAVVEVKNSVCQGCFLHIPPQLYVEIKINQSIYHCPQCGRFLYYKAEEKLEEAKV
ncbi:MAG: C4-type zinc ribbon domain-containing protein [Thermodesulfovibrio sp.]|nr:C4-type zinc ribbon domain-containing protein [Thermodesulfovibrio sp.]MDW7998506.1 C4-type zinc ribbon domain-containing protein [Thermodesulfovibrio sp.]